MHLSYNQVNYEQKTEINKSSIQVTSDYVLATVHFGMNFMWFYQKKIHGYQMRLDYFIRIYVIRNPILPACPNMICYNGWNKDHLWKKLEHCFSHRIWNMMQDNLCYAILCSVVTGLDSEILHIVYLPLFSINFQPIPLNPINPMELV